LVPSSEAARAARRLSHVPESPLKHPWSPLLSTLGIGLMLAGCGVGQQTSSSPALGTNAPAALRLEAPSAAGPGRPVVIHYRDRAQLDALAARGIDLFENVDEDHHTVGATVNERTAPILKQLGVSVDTMQATAMQGFPSGYQTVDQVYADMKQLAAAHPRYVQLVEFGQSLETLQGRAHHAMVALRFTSKRDQGLPSIRLGSGIHARELPPVEIMSRFAHTLADGYGKDAAITRLLDTREIWIVPLQNPDGRARVEHGATMWRKNTRQDDQSPEGVDCNRNADDHFSQGDQEPYADDYRGPSPFSEPESQAIRDLALKHHFDVSLDMHCFGGMVLWPPGYDRGYTADEPAFNRIGHTIGQRLGYKAGTIARTIYQTYGDLATWEYRTQKTLAFAAELDCGSFNPAYSEVDRQWKKWKPTLLYLVGETRHRGDR
jgi:hypothetical protein